MSVPTTPAADRRTATRVARALDGVEDRHVKAEARRRIICDSVHVWLEPPHATGAPNGPDGPPPLEWIYRHIVDLNAWPIAPSTVRSIHRRHCYRR